MGRSTAAVKDEVLGLDQLEAGAFSADVLAAIASKRRKNPELTLAGAHEELIAEARERRDAVGLASLEDFGELDELTKAGKVPDAPLLARIQNSARAVRQTKPGLSEAAAIEDARRTLQAEANRATQRSEASAERKRRELQALRELLEDPVARVVIECALFMGRDGVPREFHVLNRVLRDALFRLFIRSEITITAGTVAERYAELNELEWISSGSGGSKMTADFVPPCFGGATK